MPHLPVVVVGAGHSGLAMSRCLAERSIDHVVIERGEVANSWRTERWDSLRLLTPNWLTRLPGLRLRGTGPGRLHGGDGGRRPDRGLRRRQRRPGARRHDRDLGAPRGRRRLPRRHGRRRLDAPTRSWWRPGPATSRPSRRPPRASRRGSPSSRPHEYRNPGQVPEGGVLVVGASSSGVQIADELLRHGRPVTISAGEHVRLPRRYRGADILWWMEAAGVLDDGHDEIDDLVRARSIPSMQLAGSPDGDPLDLNALTGRGARLVGRLGAVRDGRALFSGSLPNVCALADLKLTRLLDRIDAWAAEAGLDAAAPPERLRPTAVPSPPALELDLRERRDPHDRLGHRQPPRARVAGAARPEPARAAGPRRRRDQVPRRLPHGDAVPAPAQVDADRRRGPGRPRAGRAPGGPPRRRRPRRPRLHPDLARS